MANGNECSANGRIKKSPKSKRLKAKDLMLFDSVLFYIYAQLNKNITGIMYAKPLE